MTSTTVGGARAASGADFGWIATLLLGLTTFALGIVLIANPFASAWTLAVLVGIGLMANGLLELLQSRRTHRAADVAAGFLWLIGVIGSNTVPRDGLTAIDVDG